MIKLLLLHFIADFLLQPREMGKKKSSEWKWLFGHLITQFFVFWPFTNFAFAALNALIHGIIDRNIWNGYKCLVLWKSFPRSMPWKERPGNMAAYFAYWEDHWFYVTIGFDQFLHTTTLVLLSGLVG